MIRRLGIFTVLVSLSTVLLASDAHAELNQDIDLTKSSSGAPSISLVRMADLRWASFGVGPSHLQGYPLGPGHQPVMGRCGCLVTSLTMSIAPLLGDASPWFSSQVWRAEIGSELYLTNEYSFSPKYVDDFLNVGPNPAKPRASGWGYGSGWSGGSCGGQVLPWGLERMASSEGFASLTGFDWIADSWSPANRARLDDALKRGIPTPVGIHMGDENTAGHVVVFVGWDNQKKKYLHLDPAMPKGAARKLVGDGWEPKGTEESNYSAVMAAVHTVWLLEPVDEQSWLYGVDDPEPIRLRVTDPRGRRTGVDPETGGTLSEDPNGMYSELSSFTDPLLELEDAPPYRYFAIRNPEPGLYGLEVFGIGDGPYTLTLGTVDDSQQDDAATVTGDIVEGQTIRYEILRDEDGSITVTEVDAFQPYARAGNDASAFIGTDVRFDGRGSSQIDAEIVSWEWDFGDGETANGAEATHAYSAAGVYEATLTVTTDAGITAEDQRMITVTDPALVPVLETRRVNLTENGDEATGNDSGSARITPDGRFVAFESRAANLVLGDTNSGSDIFVKDLATGAIERVSLDDAEGQLSMPAVSPAISADGRFVTFSVAGYVNVRDRMMGTTEVLPGNGLRPTISDDGRYVAFESTFPFAAGDANGTFDIYVYDRDANSAECASVNNAGVVGSSTLEGSRFARLTPDGTQVVFQSDATNLTSDSYAGVFVRDLTTGTTEHVSKTAAGIPTFGAFDATISADGRFVAFETLAGSVVPGINDPNNLTKDVFVRDRMSGTTEAISASTNLGVQGGDSYYSGISPDGRYVAFLSNTTTLLPNSGGTLQYYRVDRQDGSAVFVSVNDAGELAAPFAFGDQLSGGFGVSVSLNGSVAFPADADNLVPGDTNGESDVFVRGTSVSAGADTPLANLGGPYLGWATSDAVPAAIRLDGSDSVDPQNRELTAHWDFGDGSPMVDGELTTSHAYEAPGIYTVTLTVSAEGDTSAPIATEVEVLPALVPDSLSMDYCAEPGAEIVVSGTATSANAVVVAEGWDTSTGPIVLTSVTVTLPWDDVSAEPRVPGLDFRTKVEVPSDSGGAQQASAGSLSAVLEIPCPRREQALPEAHAGGPFYDGEAGSPVVFDGRGSRDEEGDELTYFWDFGDDTSGEGATPSHSYASAGIYMVTLIVHDGTDSSAPVVGTHSFAMVTVSEAAADVPPDEDGCGCDCMTSSQRPSQGWLLAGASALGLLRRRRRPTSRLSPNANNP